MQTRAREFRSRDRMQTEWSSLCIAPLSVFALTNKEPPQRLPLASVQHAHDSSQALRYQRIHANSFESSGYEVPIKWTGGGQFAQLEGIRQLVIVHADSLVVGHRASH